MKRRFRVVVFDLDDTLYPEADYVSSGCRAVAQAAADAGVCTTFREALDTILAAPTRAEGFDRLAALSSQIPGEFTPEVTPEITPGIAHEVTTEITPGIAPEVTTEITPGIAHEVTTDSRFASNIHGATEFSSRHFGITEILSIYRNHRPDIKLPEESERALQHLINQGVSLAIITDGRREGQLAKISALGLKRFIPEENIIVSADYSTDKLSPTPFRILMERFPDIPPQEYIYIGDNPAKDFFWPNKLGWATVMLLDTSGHNIHSQLTESLDATMSDFQPKYIISSLLDIESHLLHNDDYVK